MIDEEFESSLVLRFLVGAALGGLVVAVFLRATYIPFWACIVIAMSTGALASYFGDRFLILMMKMMRGLK